ncbi:hypothetical protein Ae201684P_007068 [Aphanomyces euteiches]|nr:hypothetical protein Ae201684P_007068 [Aphanomyces euteiches]
MWPLAWWLVLHVAAALAAAGPPPKNPHEIESMPGYNDDTAINFAQFAGHIRLQSTGQDMFYWLVESTSNPSLDPLVIWLHGSGDPGCSALNSLFTDVGPFVVQSDLRIKRNPYAWNRRANFLFVESIAGVGFSRPMLNATEYNDEETAARMYEFLQEFLAMYPTYHNRQVYLFGQSYGGVLVPYLVEKLVETPIESFVLAGFAVGNPFTDNQIDATLDYFYTHGLISISMYERGRDACGVSGASYCFYGGGECPQECLAVLLEGQASSQAANAQAFNLFDIFGDVCSLKSNLKLEHHAIRPLTHHGSLCGFIHIQVFTAIYCPTGDSYPRPACKLGEMQPPPVLRAGLKALIYTGDADAVDNFIGTERWIQNLQLPVREKWESWFGPDKQLAGYSTRYTNLTFTTLKGAGQLVGATRPLHALYMFECFIYGNIVCATFSYPTDDVEYLSGADLTTNPNKSQSGGALIPWAITAVIVVLGSIVGLVYWTKREERSQYIDWVVETSRSDNRSGIGYT